MLRFRSSLTGTSLVVVASLCGCAMRGNVDLLEARLRQQEDRLVRLDSQLDTTESQLAAAERESHHLREQLADRGDKVLLPEQADALFRATGIQFNKLLTGGLDRDGVAGDEILSAIVVPHDADGELVKIPGQLELQVFDLSREGEQKLIGKWQYGVEECRQLWHSGFLGSGYLIRVPWTEIPRTNRVLLHARLVTTDGRKFDTSEQMDVTPPAQPSGVIQAGRKAPAELAPIRTGKPEWDFDAAPEKPVASDPARPSSRAAPSSESDRVRTSDNWTEETLPVLR